MTFSIAKPRRSARRGERLLKNSTRFMDGGKAVKSRKRPAQEAF